MLHAVRFHNNKNMGQVIAEASVPDLEWFMQMLELQLEETPNWIKDEDQLNETQAWTRQVRTVTTGVLHNKRVASGTWEWMRMALWSLVLVFIGWALGKYL